MRTKQYIDRSDASEVRTSCHHVVEKRCKTKNNTPKLFTDGVFRLAKFHPQPVGRQFTPSQC